MRTENSAHIRRKQLLVYSYTDGGLRIMTAIKYLIMYACLRDVVLGDRASTVEIIYDNYCKYECSLCRNVHESWKTDARPTC